jgi:hypothetical protein
VGNRGETFAVTPSAFGHPPKIFGHGSAGKACRYNAKLLAGRAQQSGKGNMFNFSKLAKVVVAFVWATFGFAPLAAEITKRWAERNGYIDHPEKGIGWVLSMLGAVTDFPWFYPAVAFMTGVLIGDSMDHDAGSVCSLVSRWSR